MIRVLYAMPECAEKAIFQNRIYFLQIKKNERVSKSFLALFLQNTHMKLEQAQCWEM